MRRNVGTRWRWGSRALLGCLPLVLLCATAAIVRAAPGAQGEQERRRFADRPVSWEEHDDAGLDRAPRATDLQRLPGTLLLRDSLANDADRILSLEGDAPARDVNAADEVPCSTWFCPRNHLRPMDAAAIAAGPPGTPPPRLPLRITRGKDQGAASGLEVRDADGRKFLIKFDPTGHLGMTTGAEAIGARLFHAAGYNVPAAFILNLEPGDLTLDPNATFKLYRVQKRPLTATRVVAQLAGAARLPDGRLRVVASSWLDGQVLGSFDMLGVRADDPNDRIPHQHRRSLRASLVLFAWLGVLDAGAINTLDTYVQENGRHFVRHNFIDFGAGLGSATTRVKGPHEGQTYFIEVGRTMRGLFSGGLYRRPFQDQRRDWAEQVATQPSVGWFPDHPFDPRQFRTSRKVPAHQHLTAQDAYWGAKLVTSFSDQQIAAVVAAAEFPEQAAQAVEQTLRDRRDAIGRSYLRTMTAVEEPAVSRSGDSVCFFDLAIARGYRGAPEIQYLVDVRDRHRGGDRLLATTVPAAGSGTCVPIGPSDRRSGYRVVAITAADGATPSTAAAETRLHLRWRESERRFVVVGLERDNNPGGQPSSVASDGPSPLLAVPRLASRVVFWPVVKTSTVLERHQVFDWMRAVLTSDDGLIGVRPQLQFYSGFLPTVGLRFFDRRLPWGDSELGASFLAAGPDAIATEVMLRAPSSVGLALRSGWDHRADRVFAGVGPNSKSDLEASGQGVARYASDALFAELQWTRTLRQPLSLQLHGDVQHRTYDASDVRGGPSVADLYGAPAGSGEAVDPALLPGFDEGQRLLHGGARLALNLQDRARDGGGFSLAAGGTYAHGIGGDPSQHVTVSAETVAALGGRDRALLFRVWGAAVHPVGGAPVPFEELVIPSGSHGMRGFPYGRFRGESGLVGSVEYRWLIAYNLDASLFVDEGAVAGRWFSGLDRDSFFPSVGVGLRIFNPYTSRYWRAPLDGGVQVAYAPDGGFRFLLTTAAF